MLPHVSSEQPLLCDPKDVGTPTVRVDSFSSNIYTGSQFEATINALHVAACCAGTAVLPDHGADFPDRSVSTCFDFRRLRRVARLVQTQPRPLGHRPRDARRRELGRFAAAAARASDRRVEPHRPLHADANDVRQRDGAADGAG